MLLALCGPTCIGKTYAKKAILRHRPEVKELRWYTTKPLDADEQVGRHLTEEQFQRNLDFGQLVLVEERDDGYSYGFSKRDIIRNDVLFVTELRPGMIFELREVNPEIKAISLITEPNPSGLRILGERLKRRQLSSQEIDQELKDAVEEMRLAREQYDSFDVSVLVNERSQDTFLTTILSLTNALAPAL